MCMNYTNNEIDFLKNNYSDKGANFCSKSLNRNYWSIISKAGRLGLRISKELKSKQMKRCSKMERTRPKNAKSVDLNQFIDIKSKEIAYILGLIWADGHIHKYKVSVTSLKTDLEQIYPFFMKTGEWSMFCVKQKRYEVQCQEVMSIYSSNKEMANIFTEYDYHVKSDKSACKVLSKIPENLQHYWFRAFFDGDGYIWYSKECMYKITLTSNKDQNWKFMEKLCNKLSIVYHIRRDSYKNKQGRINSRSVFIINNFHGVKSFCEYIYKGCKNDNMYYYRKYNKWLEMKDFMKNHPPKAANAINKYLL